MPCTSHPFNLASGTQFLPPKHEIQLLFIGKPCFVFLAVCNPLCISLPIDNEEGETLNRYFCLDTLFPAFSSITLLL